MVRANRSKPRGFTLTEMLVVIGIIAILAALLLPAVNQAIYAARNTAISVEVNQLATAIESYKQDKGDYPPNLRDRPTITRHVMKCYPKINQAYFLVFMTYLFPPNPATTAPVIDESESLVFWLSMTDNDPQYPFLSLPLINPVTNAPYSVIKPANPKKYYDFDQTRLSKSNGLDVPSYLAKYCKDTFYIYIDSRSYDNPATDTWDLCRFQTIDGADNFAIADDTATGVRPYWGDPVPGNAKQNYTGTSVLTRDKYKPMNPTTFQIICAGQDGDFGMLLSSSGAATIDADAKSFPSGLNYNQADKDNITNFSNGRRLADNVP